MRWSARAVGAACVVVFGAAGAEGVALECPDLTFDATLGEVQAGALDEASGLAVSWHDPRVLWTHNDSGDRPRLFALRRDGKLLGTFTIPGASAVDWEDLAIGPCAPGSDAPCLFIADFGNNSQARTDQIIYRVPEPVVDPEADDAIEADTAQADALPFAYPFGGADPNPLPDAEGLAVDPRTGDLIVFTKESPRGRVLRIAAPHRPMRRATAELVGDVALSTITGADWSRDGSTLSARGYFTMLTFTVQGDEDLAQTLGRPPAELRLKAEPQGEALALGYDGAEALTTSEGDGEPIFLYTCTPPAMVEADMGVDMGAGADMGAGVDMGVAVDLGASADMSVGGDMAQPGNNALDAGCSCRTASTPAPGAPILALCGALVIGLARRRRARSRATLPTPDPSR